MYDNYRGKSVGRILHHIYIHSNLHYAERVTVVGSTITYCNEPFATVEWKIEGRIDVPVIKFCQEFDGYNKRLEYMYQFEQDDIIREQKHVIDTLFGHATFLYERLSIHDLSGFESQRLHKIAGEFLEGLDRS